MCDQPATRLDEAGLEAGQRPRVDPRRQDQPPPEIPEVESRDLVAALAEPAAQRFAVMDVATLAVEVLRTVCAPYSTRMSN